MKNVMEKAKGAAIIAGFIMAVPLFLALAQIVSTVVLWVLLSILICCAGAAMFGCLTQVLDAHPTVRAALSECERQERSNNRWRDAPSVTVGTPGTIQAVSNEAAVRAATVSATSK